MNLRKHGVDFADAATVLHDELAVTALDDDPDEGRVVTMLVRGRTMKSEYDFGQGKRGAVVASGRGKTRITIRIDDDVLLWFRRQVHKAGGGSYQTSINAALRAFIAAQETDLEATLRRVLREELPRYGARRAAGLTHGRTRRLPG